MYPHDAYQAFIASIDNSAAGSDEFGNLAWHIDCSATANANEAATEEDFYVAALDTAKMILDCWQDYYPQLVKAEASTSDVNVPDVGNELTRLAEQLSELWESLDDGDDDYANSDTALAIATMESSVHALIRKLEA